MLFRLNTFILTGLGIVSLSLVSIGQDAPTAPLDEQLKAQYTLITSCGANGTVLVVQKDGLLGAPQGVSIPTSKYQDGKLHEPSSSILGKVPGIGPLSRVPQTYQQVTRPFSQGLKVYPTSIQVNAAKDVVTMTVLDCNTNFRSNVAFQFRKGALQKTSVPEVVDVISQVLAFDQSPDPQSQAQQAAPATPDQSAPSEPQAEAPTIRIGETIDQVIVAFGQPEKRVDKGPDQIFMYKNLKVTFKDGKVSAAE